MILLSLALVSWGAFAQHDHSKMGHSTEGHTTMESNMTDKPMGSPTVQVKHSQSVSAIVDNYLALKDALVQDDSENAASSGKKLLDAFTKFDLSEQGAKDEKELAGIIENASDHAGSISENRGNIANQREHFEMLSKDMRDLIFITGSDRTLYLAFCPMYNKNKGGIWLSASSEIKNPFYGHKMLKCGSVQQEISVE